MLKAFEARWRHAGGGAGGLVSLGWGLGGEAPEKCCNLALLETPWFAYFSIVANAKNNAQEDYNGYKKAFGWYKVVIVKVSIEATCYHFKPWHIWRIPSADWRVHLELCHRNPDTLKRPGAMLNQSRDPINYGEVRTSASLTARTVESFDHQEKYFSPYRRTITSYFKYISIGFMFRLVVK